MQILTAFIFCSARNEPSNFDHRYMQKEIFLMFSSHGFTNPKSTNLRILFNKYLLFPFLKGLPFKRTKKILWKQIEDS